MHGLKVHSGCKCSELNWKDVSTYSVELFFKSISQHYVSLSLKRRHMRTLRHVYTHIFSFQKRQLQSALTNFFFSVSSPISHSLSCLFPTFFFASVSPWAVYYTAKVKLMSPLCLKPNAPVCQRAQLYEEQVNLDFKM